LRAGNHSVVLLALVVTATLAGSAGVSAHRLDECLQAARIAIEPDHVELELDLTPGRAVADAIVADIDRDRDGSLSPGERQAYVARVLGDVRLEVDGRPLDVKAAAATFAQVEAFRSGEGTIRIRAGAVLPRNDVGAHRLFFRNSHRRDVSVYLANALVPASARIGVTAQRHTAEQQDLTIDYVVREGRAMSLPGWLVLAGALGAALYGWWSMRYDRQVLPLSTGTP
jgi:hypothetical protein